MQSMIMNVILEYGYLAVFMLMFIENIFPPIPSELILGFVGYLIMSGYYDYLGMYAVAICGSYLGSYIFYFIGWLFDEKRLSSLLKTKCLTYLGFRQKTIQKSNAWFLRYGHYIVFYGRFVPMMRSVVSIPAGMNHMPFLKFSFYSLLGIMIWNGLLILLGIYLGVYWQNIVYFVQDYFIVIIIIFIIFLIIKVLPLIRQRMR